MKRTNETTLTNELELKIQQLTEDFNLKKLSNELLPNIKHMAIIHRWKKINTLSINIDIKNIEELKEVISKLPCTGKETQIGTEIDSYYVTLLTGYRIDIRNNVKGAIEAEIQYISNQYEVRIIIPIEMIEKFVVKTERKIYDCENHYFIGYSYKQLNNLRISSYRFECMKEISWYGGNKTLTSTNETIKIINSLLK